MTAIEQASERCTHCGACTEACAFLAKYGLALGDVEALEALSFHCFLCGDCSRVCPEGIDGRQLVLQMRERRNAEAAPKGYGALLAEKRRYPFRNYRHACSQSVFFPGCSLISFYPKTTAALSALLLSQADIGTVYDCCGKPIEDIGLSCEADEVVDQLIGRLRDRGVRELVVACPNCFGFLKDRFQSRSAGIGISSVYRKLSDIGFDAAIDGAIPLWRPCPDRDGGEMLESIRPFLSEQPMEIPGIQCCGCGGWASYHEPELAQEMAAQINATPAFTTYCATCSGVLTRAGGNVHHVLADLLETGETADVSKSVWNRMRAKAL